MPVIVRIYVPDLEKIKTCSPPKAEGATVEVDVKYGSRKHESHAIVISWSKYQKINGFTRERSRKDGVPEDNGPPINRKDENMDAEWRYERLDKVPIIY